MNNQKNKRGEKAPNHIIEEIRHEYLVNLLSINKIHKLKKYRHTHVKFALKDVKRGRREGLALSASLPNPNRAWSSERKANQSKKRIAYLRKRSAEGLNPIWKSVNEGKRSRGEQRFYELIMEHHLFERYDIIERFPFHTYEFDFAFLNIKLDVEIDGNVHFVRKEQIERDERRNKFVIENGWSYYRIRDLDLLYNTDIVFSQFLRDIESFNFNQKKYDAHAILSRQQYLISEEDCKKALKLQKKEKKRSIIDEKVNQLLSSDIDFSAHGWVNQAAKLMSMRRQHVPKWIKRNAPELHERVFKRKLRS